MKNKKKSFKFVYLCILGVFVLLSAICLIYVGNILSGYEASQPERIVENQIEKISAAAKKTDSAFSALIQLTDLSDEEKTELRNTLATKTLTYELRRNSGGGEELVYTILADGNRALDVTVTGKTGKTKLFLFPMTKWDLVSVTPSSYEFSFTLPETLTVILDGQVVTGQTLGEKLKYEITTPSKPDLIIKDAIGNTVEYDGKTKLSVTEYLIRIPSNYKITSKTDTAASLDLATLEDISAYKYVAQYTEMPKMATYELALLGETPEFVIVDNMGTNVDFTVEDHTVVIEDQAATDIIPEGFMTAADVLEDARTWSLFMTADLGGNYYGYYTVETRLLPDSYIRDVAFKWATGIDITFTSIHWLDNPPFFDESVTGFVKYSDNCFSCDVTLSKVMHLNSGLDVTDSMNSRFYYILKDGIWYLADIQEIITDKDAAQ